MINRDNWKLVKKYMTYLSQVMQRDPQTVDRYWCSLRHLLEWANSVRIANVRGIRPVFPTYLAERGMVRDGVARSCNVARAFFAWLKESYPGRYTRVTDVWLDTLRPAREPEKSKQRDVYTLEDIRKIAALPTETLADQRDVAAVVMLFLSGMRVGAFTSLTIDCVDLRRRAIKQFPELGGGRLRYDCRRCDKPGRGDPPQETAEREKRNAEQIKNTRSICDRPQKRKLWRFHCCQGRQRHTRVLC